MGFRIHRGIFQKLNSDRTAYENAFKMDTDGRLKPVDRDGTVTGAYLTSVPDEFLTQTEGDGRYLRSAASQTITGNFAVRDATRVNHQFENYSTVATYRSDAPYWRLWMPESQEQIAAVNGGEVRLSYDGTTRLKTYSSGVQTIGEHKATTFIIPDAADGNRYSKSSSFLNPRDNWQNYHLKDAHGEMYFDSNRYHFRTRSASEFGLWNSSELRLKSGSISLDNGDVYANRFYDKNNTGYYLDAASTSRLEAINGDRYYQVGHGRPMNNLGSPTVTEMALFDPQFTCKTDLSNSYDDMTDLTFWVQQNQGDSWREITDHDDNQKKKFLRTNGSNIYIPNRAYKFRVEFNAKGYTFANAIYFYWSSQSHNSQVHIWKKRCSDGEWLQHTNATNTVSSWPGHLYLPFSTIPWHETNTTSTGHFTHIRVEFTPNWSGHATYGDRNINLYGGQIWGGYPSGRRTPHFYNEHGNVYFPGNLYAEGSSSDNKRLVTRDWVSWSNVGNKPTSFTPSSHQHAWSEITSKPTTFTPSAHTHAWGDITGKPSTFSPSSHSHNFITNTTSYVSSGALQSWDRQESTPDLNPSTDWFTALRIGHGHPVDYYSNTLAIQMTGSDLGRIYTRTISNGSKGTWRKYWHGGDFSSTNVSNWNTAYGWGNHASAGYLTSGSSFSAANVTITGYIKGNGQQLVLNAGEAHAYATGQGDEKVYVNAENGLEVTTATNNWQSGWSAKKISTLTGTQLTIDGETFNKTNIQEAKSAPFIDRSEVRGPNFDSLLPSANETHFKQVAAINEGSNFPSGAYTYGVLQSTYMTSMKLQWYVPHTASRGSNATQDTIYFRTNWGGGNWYNWRYLVHSANISSFLTWGNITGKPTTFTPPSTYLTTTDNDGRYLRRQGSQQITKDAHTRGASAYHLELYSPQGSTHGEVSIRFHQGGRYWGQIRYDGSDFKFTQGSDSSYRTLKAGAIYSNDNLLATQAWVTEQGYLTSETDSQTLSISGTTLSISNGNSVTIPTSIGPQGPQGDPGRDGANGRDGARGADGARGPAGPAGAQGPQGPQGERGPAGSAASIRATATGQEPSSVSSIDFNEDDLVATFTLANGRTYTLQMLRPR